MHCRLSVRRGPSAAGSEPGLTKDVPTAPRAEPRRPARRGRRRVVDATAAGTFTPQSARATSKQGEYDNGGGEGGSAGTRRRQAATVENDTLYYVTIVIGRGTAAAEGRLELMIPALGRIQRCEVIQGDRPIKPALTVRWTHSLRPINDLRSSVPPSSFLRHVTVTL